VIIDHGKKGEKLAKVGKPKGKKPFMTQKLVMDAYTKAAGVTSEAARLLGIDKCNLLAFVRKNEMRSKIIEVRVGMVDLAEDNVYDALALGDVKTSIYVLRCIGGDKWIPQERTSIMEKLAAQAIGLPPPTGDDD
jgi:hypothetical protein